MCILGKQNKRKVNILLIKTWKMRLRLYFKGSDFKLKIASVDVYTNFIEYVFS